MAKAGDVLGDFQILREVGRGSMGVVYEATQRSLGRRVAVKVLAPTAAGDPVWIERFHTEASAAARLSHPGILPVYAIGDDGAVPWFAMEFVEGKDVSEIVAEGGPLAPREAARIVRDAALALDHAHLQGVVHRDVKPGNLMVRKDGRVVLTDFGLAKHVGSGSLTTTGSLVGTPYYMSPEQAIGDRLGTGPKTDVYGLGASLYEMLVGRPPFEAENAVAFLRMISEKEPPPIAKRRPGVPRDLETIVLAAMEKKPDRRYASCRDLADDLDRFLRDEPISRRRPGPVERATRIISRNRVASAAVLGSLLLLGGGYALYVTQIAAKEAEIDQRIEEALRESERAISRGDVAAAETSLVKAANAPNATPQEKERTTALLNRVFRRKLEGRGGATISEGESSIEDTLGVLRGKIPTTILLNALPPAQVTLRTDPADATVEAASLQFPNADVIPLAIPVVGRTLGLGLWSLTVRAAGRVPLRITVGLFEPDAKLEASLRLPLPDEVPADMVPLGGEVVRARGRVGGIVFDLPAFLLDRTEVTVGAYARFLSSLAEEERRAFTPSSWPGGRAPAGADDLPVTGVTWEMADRFAASLGKRLPSREELELAALGTTIPGKDRRVPFDPASFHGKANVQGSEAGSLWPVGRADAYLAPSGVADLLGNAAEWSGSTAAGDPWRVLVLGGSFREQLGPQTTARFPGEANESVGFRCAKSLGTPPLRDLPAAAPAGRRVVVERDGSASGEKGGPPGRTLPTNTLFVRQGRRFDIDVAADDGAEVLLPAGSLVTRNGHAHAAVGLESGPAVRLEPARGESLRVEAFVPDAAPADADVREAAAFLDRVTEGVERRMDLDAYAAALAPDYWSDLFRDRAGALKAFEVVKATYERIASRGQPWGADRFGPDLVVVRRRVDARELTPKGGGAAVVPGHFPSIHEAWCRRSPDGKGWQIAYETDRPLGERVGRLEPDGTWRSDAMGLSVRPPYGASVTGDESGLSDLSVRVPLDGEALTGGLSVYRRVDEKAGVPALKAADWKKYGYEVMSIGTETLRGRAFPALTTLRDESGVFLATRRVVVRRGEGAVMLTVTGRSTRSRVEALAIVEGHRDAMRAFLDSIYPEERAPR